MGEKFKVYPAAARLLKLAASASSEFESPMARELLASGKKPTVEEYEAQKARGAAIEAEIRQLQKLYSAAYRAKDWRRAGEVDDKIEKLQDEADDIMGWTLLAAVLVD